MKIAVVGATGLVGSVMLQVLAERGFGNCELIPAASERSVGKTVRFNGREYVIVSVEDAVEAVPDIAVFSAGGAVSKRYAPAFASKGTYVVDNSSAWRGDADVPLVVPEINGNVIEKEDHIIANPNCSTIQMVLALWPLHKELEIRRIVVSTYQSVTGTGMKAVRQLAGERAGEPCEKAYPHQIDLNVLPHGGDFLDNGYTTEEEKLVNETRKIFNDSSLHITATVARVPVLGGHSESVNVEFAREFTMPQVFGLLTGMSGVTVLDDPSRNLYPMPLDAQGKDDVFVGRLRRDYSRPKSLNMWIVSDNLRKGAATNAVQIVQLLSRKFF